MNVYRAPKSIVAEEKRNNGMIFFLVLTLVILGVTNIIGESADIFHKSQGSNFIKSTFSGFVATLVFWLPAIYLLRIKDKASWLYLFSFLFGSFSIIVITVAISYLTGGNKQDLESLLSHLFDSYDALIYMGLQWLLISWVWLNRSKIFLTKVST